MVLNTEEIATLFHLPSFLIDTPGIRWFLAKRSPAPANIPQEGLLLGENVVAAAGDTFPPEKALGRCDGIALFRLLIAVIADHVALFAARLAGAGDAEIFALDAPADDVDLLRFADESADFLAGVVAAAESAAELAAKGSFLQKGVCANRGAEDEGHQ